MSIALLLVALAGIVALLIAWAFWFAPRLGQQRLETAQRSAMIALHTITALAILSAGLFYLDEQQWTPRLGVELKADTRLVPDSSPATAVAQVSIGITNKTETSQNVNFIEVSASRVSQTARPDPQQPDELAGSGFYRFRTSRPSEVGPDETHFEFVEIPIRCDWNLVRVTVKVPRPPAREPGHGKQGFVYERKLLVATHDACAANDVSQSIRRGAST